MFHSKYPQIVKLATCNLTMDQNTLSKYKLSLGKLIKLINRHHPSFDTLQIVLKTTHSRTVPCTSLATVTTTDWILSSFRCTQSVEVASYYLVCSCRLFNRSWLKDYIMKPLIDWIMKSKPLYDQLDIAYQSKLDKVFIESLLCF